MTKKEELFFKEESHPHSHVAVDPVVDLFTCYTPSADMLHRMDTIRAAFIIVAKSIHEHCPASADRTAAMRKLKEAHMTINSAIMHKGRSYR